MTTLQYCNICNQKLGEPIYVSPRNISVTSNADIVAIPTQVYFCETCGHLETPPFDDLESYYDTGYNILTDSDDEDQLYQSIDGQKAFRADFQLETLLKKQTISPNAKILDFGSGKGTTLRRLALRRPDIAYSLFDVSQAYVPFWEKFATPDQWATYTLPETWDENFDLVISFYVLEHVAELQESVKNVARVLKPGGVFYFIVPNVYANTGDFVVVDHVNHFSEESLHYLLERSQLSVIEIDKTTHDSAFIVTAQKTPPSAYRVVESSRLSQQVNQISEYWLNVIEQVQAFETKHPDKPVAIYGAGFYGTYIATCLTNLSRVRCFIDQNPYKQNEKILDIPVIAPKDLPEDIETIYVGLNPRKAVATIDAISVWSERHHSYFFL
ncbi:MAG: methyltransferase domain-containing protein [Anaerolineaceae bacterium]|nr:methyltransferase domain-containing protein [Anaerolineaceae bacterium]